MLIIWPGVSLSAVSPETNSPYSICICSIQFPFGNWLTLCFPIRHNHQIICLVVIKRQIMEKKRNPNLIFVRPEHYNQKLELEVRRHSLCNTHSCDCFFGFLPVFYVFVSKWLHPYKASHLFTITQHITVNGTAEARYDVPCYSQNEHSPLPMHLQPPGRAHDIPLTLTHYHCKWTTVNTFSIAAQ